MLDIKECRKIKRDYTKNTDAKKVIINVENYPYCYIIVTHGDGKSWGYFYDVKEHLYLGRSNQKICAPIYQIGEYSLGDNDYAYEIIGGNDAVKEAYKSLISDFCINHHWLINGYFDSCLKIVFKINPKLFANLADCNVFRDYRYSTYKFYNLTRVNYYPLDSFDYTKPLIKDAFGLPPKWVKLLFTTRCEKSNIERFRKYNYTPEELISNSRQYYITGVPDWLIPNKEATLMYLDSSKYRDYCNMRDQLPKEVKSEFPCLPKDINKYHDKIIPIYNREQAFKKKKELEDKQNKYIENFYKKAIEYNYADDTYFIKACEELTDLLVEGNTLHHCVGSYVNSVSEGREYILFLRKASDPDIPYFTIDVTPNGQVRQIHGLRNCNIDDEIKPFVDIWAKKFKLNLEGCSGVRCALC